MAKDKISNRNVNPSQVKRESFKIDSSIFSYLAWLLWILFQPFRYIFFVIGCLITVCRVGYIEARSLIGRIRVG